MITTAQIRLLHTAVSRAGVDDDTYRDLLQAEAGVRSSKELDNASLSRVLKRLEELGFTNTARRAQRRPPANANAAATRDQLELLADLQHELGICDEGLARLAARVVKRPVDVRSGAVALRSRSEAAKLTEALKALKKKRARVAAAPDEQSAADHGVSHAATATSSSGHAR